MMSKRDPGKRQREQRKQTYPTGEGVYLYTDGSSKLFDGLAWGGWAAILRFGEHEVEYTGCQLGGTTGRMELTAILEGLHRVKSSYAGRILVVSDSQYAINALTIWWPKWQENDWKTGSGLPVENLDVIRAILELREGHSAQIAFRWVKGHAGHKFNERCDVLATEARHRLQREIMGAYKVKDGPMILNPVKYGKYTVGSDGSGNFIIALGRNVLKLNKDEARDIAYDLADRIKPREDRESPIHRYESKLAKAIDIATQPKDPPPVAPVSNGVPRVRVRTRPAGVN